MAASMYDLGRDACVNKQVDLINDTIKVALVGAGYVANMTTDQFYTSISSAVIGTPSTLTSKSTNSSGTFSAANIVTATIASGSTITQAVIYQDTGTAGTSRLLAREDVTPNIPTNGGTVTIAWDTGANKIFKI